MLCKGFMIYRGLTIPTGCSGTGFVVHRWWLAGVTVSIPQDGRHSPRQQGHCVTLEVLPYKGTEHTVIRAYTAFWRCTVIYFASGVWVQCEAPSTIPRYPVNRAIQVTCLGCTEATHGGIACRLNGFHTPYINSKDSSGGLFTSLTHRCTGPWYIYRVHCHQYYKLLSTSTSMLIQGNYRSFRVNMSNKYIGEGDENIC